MAAWAAWAGCNVSTPTDQLNQLIAQTGGLKGGIGQPRQLLPLAMAMQAAESMNPSIPKMSPIFLQQAIAGMTPGTMKSIGLGKIQLGNGMVIDDPTYVAQETDRRQERESDDLQSQRNWDAAHEDRVAQQGEMSSWRQQQAEESARRDAADKARQTQQDRFQNLTTLSGDSQRLLQKTVDQYESVDKFLHVAQSGSDTGAASAALSNMYQQLIDPGAMVRREDLEILSGVSGAAQKLDNAITNMRSGEFLDAGTIADMSKVAMAVRERLVKSGRGVTQGLIKRGEPMGFRPDEYIMYPQFLPEAAPQGGAPASGPPPGAVRPRT